MEKILTVTLKCVIGFLVSLVIGVPVMLILGHFLILPFFESCLQWYGINFTHHGDWETAFYFSVAYTILFIWK